MADTCFVPTRSSSLKTTAVQYQEVVYEDASKKRNANSVETSNAHKYSTDSFSHSDTSNEFDIKRAKFEMKQFVKNCGTAADKQKTNKELAIELGARPKKDRTCINYKVLLEERRKAKEQKNVNKGYTPDETSAKYREKNNFKSKNEDILDIYGTVDMKNNKKMRYQSKRKKM